MWESAWFVQRDFVKTRETERAWESEILLMVQKSQGQPPFGWCLKPIINNGINYQPTGELIGSLSHIPLFTGFLQIPAGDRRISHDFWYFLVASLKPPKKLQSLVAEWWTSHVMSHDVNSHKNESSQTRPLNDSSRTQHTKIYIVLIEFIEMSNVNLW